MTCRDIDSALMRQEALPPETREHVRDCPRCAALLQALPAGGDGIELRPELARAIGERIARDLSPVRPLRPAAWYAAGFAAIFLAPIVAGIGLLRPAGIAAMNASMIAIAFGCLAVGAGLLAISLAADMAPGSRRFLPPAVLTSGVLLAVAATLWVLFPYRAETGFWVNSGNCLLAGFEFAAPAALLAWVLLRHGALLSPAVSGASAGLLGGLAGAVVLEIRCPDWNVAHVLVGHWGTALGCATLGLLTGLVAEKMRRAQPRC
jgi:hypothetical protein